MVSQAVFQVKIQAKFFLLNKVPGAGGAASPPLQLGLATGCGFGGGSPLGHCAAALRPLDSILEVGLSPEKGNGKEGNDYLFRQ